MARAITIEAFYPGDADEIFASALDFSELRAAMSGLATYEGLPEGEAQEGQHYTLDVTLFGWMKNAGHEIFLETLNRQERWLQSRERNATIRRWDHHLSVQPHEKGAVWTDTVILDAGWQTWFVSLFVAYVYRYRHKRRETLSLKSWSKRGLDD